MGRTNTLVLALAGTAFSLGACGGIAGGVAADAATADSGHADGAVVVRADADRPPIGFADSGRGPLPVQGQDGGPIVTVNDGGPRFQQLDGSVVTAGDGGGPKDPDASSPPPAKDAAGPTDLVDAALPDSSASQIETFEVISNGSLQEPLSCPTSHWEFGITGTITLRNTGGVPLAYIAEGMGWELGVQYTPGVPTSESGEQVGVLAPGAALTLDVTQPNNDLVVVIGASKPFSISDAGYAPADEWTIPWPQGVSGSGGSATMFVAEIEGSSACSPVARPI